MSREPTLADAGELEVLRRLDRFLPGRAEVAGGSLSLGAGDDAALWEPLPGEAGAITTDTLVEGTHFGPPGGPEEVEALGWKLVAVSVSDLAAMAARPAALFLSLSLPSSWPLAWIDALFAGAAACARSWDCGIAGGNLASAPLPVLTSTAVGSVDPAKALRREGARTGWALGLTGQVGGAGAALRARAGGALEQPAWRERLDRPRPRVEAGLALQAAGIRVALDVSDGLFLDAGRLLAGGGMRAPSGAAGSGAAGLILEAADLPLAPGIREAWPGSWLELAGAGEDYELLFAGPAELVAAGCEAVTATGLAATPIGRFVESPGLRINHEGRISAAPGVGYVHFHDRA